MNESRVRRPSEILDMMDDIDRVFGPGIDNSEIDDILDRNNASEDDSGEEGYFATMSNSDIENAWNEVQRYLQSQLLAGHELDSELCDRFKVKLSKSAIAKLYNKYRDLNNKYAEGFCYAADIISLTYGINLK